MNSGSAHGRVWGRAAWVYFFLVLAAYAGVVLAGKLPPAFVDYPDWVYEGVLFHAVLTGHPVAGYALKHYPVPNSLTTVGLGLLDGFLPWQMAGKVWVVLYLALAGVSFWMVMRALRVRATLLLVIVPGILFVNLDFWYGHISFEMGMCLVLMLLALLVRGASSVVVAGLLVLIFFMHMEACGIAFLLLGVWCWMAREWRRVMAAIPALGLTCWYGIARVRGGNLDAGSVPGVIYRYGSPAFLVYKVNTFTKVFGYVNARTMDGCSISERLLGKWGFLLMLGLSLVLAGICLVKIVFAAIQQATQQTRGAGTAPQRRVIAWFALALLCGSAVLPQQWLGVADPGSRLVLVAAGVGLLIVDWKGRGGWTAAAICCLLCWVNLWQLTAVERDPRMAGRVRDLPGAVLQYGHVEPGARLGYYDKLQAGEMDQEIFTTALFYRPKP
jgi:hypothetical protein